MISKLILIECFLLFLEKGDNKKCLICLICLIYIGGFMTIQEIIEEFKTVELSVEEELQLGIALMEKYPRQAD